MDWKTYASKAQVLIEAGNLIGALTTLEEGVRRFKNDDLIRLLGKARSKLRHMDSKDSYKAFYEKQQSKPKKYYKLGRRIERAIKGALGIRTRRVVDGGVQNPSSRRHAAGTPQKKKYVNVKEVGYVGGHF